MKKIIATLVAVFVGAGFSGYLYSVANAQDEAEAQTAAKIIDCQGAPVTHINIVFGNGVILVVPPRAEARVGDQLQFVVPANIKETVYVGGKESDGIWLMGRSTIGASKFTVCVPENLEIPDTDEGKVFGYFVNIPNIGYLDPEVIVRR